MAIRREIGRISDGHSAIRKSSLIHTMKFGFGTRIVYVQISFRKRTIINSVFNELCEVMVCIHIIFNFYSVAVLDPKTETTYTRIFCHSIALPTPLSRGEVLPVVFHERVKCKAFRLMLIFQCFCCSHRVSQIDNYIHIK